jgi:hypothetical protein
MFYRNYVRRSNVVGAGIVAFIAGAATWAIFGKTIKDKLDKSERYQELKKEVYDKASEVADITQDRYNQIVDEVTNKYAQVKGISNNEMKDLVDDLKWHWRRIKSSWDNNRYSNSGV